MNLERAQKVEDEYSKITREVAERWKDLIGFGCGYFNRWFVNEGNVIVYYERPQRLGGGMCDEPDIIPQEYFEIEDNKEAVERYKEYVNERRKSK